MNQGILEQTVNQVIEELQTSFFEESDDEEILDVETYSCRITDAPKPKHNHEIIATFEDFMLLLDKNSSVMNKTMASETSLIAIDDSLSQSSLSEESL